MTLSVIGAAFGRTGTLSLKLALEQLNYKCHHMVDVIQNPAQAQNWIAAAEGKPTHWDSLLDGYQAAVDWPATYFLKELMQTYPNAKVILTERDPDSWYRSISNTIFNALEKPSQSDGKLPEAQQSMGYLLIMKNTFQERPQDKDFIISVYQQHVAWVKENVPTERLVSMNISDGWEPLCKALDVAVPTTPFPRANTTEEFQQRFVEE